jgi:hypothetical protein
MASLFLVQELNNLGIQSLEQQDYERALEFFRHALYQAKATIQSHRQESAALRTVTYNNGSSSRPSKRFKSATMTIMTSTTTLVPPRREESINLFRSTNLARNCLAESEKNKGVDPSTLHLMCTRGLSMVEPPTIEILTDTATPSFSHNALEEVNIHFAMVIFNLGLVCQSAAAGQHLQQQRVTTYLQQSKTLYYQAYRLLAPIMEESFQGQSSGNALLDLLYLSVLHNWLQACSEAARANETELHSCYGVTQDQTCTMTNPVSARLIRLARSVRSSTYYSSSNSNSSSNSSSESRTEETHRLEEVQEIPLLRSMAEFCLVNASTFRLNPREAAPAA